MVTYTEAVDIARDDSDESLHTAWDFGRFYLFAFAPPGFPPGEPCSIGTMFTAVDKSSGRKYLYDITSDLDAYENAKVIKI